MMEIAMLFAVGLAAEAFFAVEAIRRGGADSAAPR